MGFLFNVSSSQAPGLAVVFAMLFGISGTMGMINMYYTLGVIGKKYNSMRYVQSPVSVSPLPLQSSLRIYALPSSECTCERHTVGVGAGIGR